MTPDAIVASIRVTRWRPLAIAMVVGSLYAWLGSKVGASDRLAASAAAVAAMSAFVIDDPAAITVASTPPSLLARRMSRVLVAVVALAAWWTILVATAHARFGPLPVRALSIQLIGLVSVALAVAAVAAGAGLAERDGLAGATATMIVYGLTLAPLPSWSPMPRSPGTAGTATRWLVVTAISAAVFLWTSRDPASNRWPRPTMTFG
ncbi:MAG TPA: hypothetical protein VMY16_06030 [Ilumatobacteraceae bacterium]|nr:hypothetical protein [Ilumatobacteraceae bacterium]